MAHVFEAIILWRNNLLGQQNKLMIQHDANQNKESKQYYLDKFLICYRIYDHIPSLEWTESFETKYKWSRDAILTDSPVFIYIPFNNKQLEASCNELNQVKSICYSNYPEALQQELAIMKLKCIFNLIKTWCLQIIYQRIAVPVFMVKQHLFQIYFRGIMAEYMMMECDCGDYDHYDLRYDYNGDYEQSKSVDSIRYELDEIKYVSFHDVLIDGYIENIKENINANVNEYSFIDICNLIKQFYPIFYDSINGGYDVDVSDVSGDTDGDDDDECENMYYV